ncbi:MAG: SDR family NAD(P)-dependent oxidoreductase [Alphaproteobacteria bacterium]
MAIRLDGRVAIVTGAGNGLGRTYALALAARGAKVVVNDLGAPLDGSGGSQAPADAVVAEIKAAGGEAVASFDSVSDRDSAARIVKTAVDAFGTVDIVVNNAGVLRDRTFHKTTLDDFEFVLKVHLLGAAYVTHAAFPIMREKGYGRILMVTSNTGLYGNFGQTAYGAAKLGVVGLMNTLKLEGAKYNVTVNALAPMAITRMTAPTALFEKVNKTQIAPEQVASMVVWLASEDCTATGQILVATGGYYSSVRYVEGAGARMDKQKLATPEDIQRVWSQILDGKGGRSYNDVSDNMAFAVLGE